jgi:hypothetical protein
MVVGAFVDTIGNSMKPVDIELALKGLVLDIIEISGHYFSNKDLYLVDAECFSMGLPRNDVAISGTGDIFKHLIEFDRE